MNTVKKLKMQLFGTFCLTDGEQVLDEKVFRSKTLIRLLIYFLINRDQVLTHQALIELFWPNESKNPESALMNQIHLIRDKLKAFGEDTFICTMRGAYYWNPEIKVETDYELFEQLIQEWDFCQSEHDKDQIEQKIIAAYGNNVTPLIEEENWILNKKAWYRTCYMDAVQNVCEKIGIEEKTDYFLNICEKYHKKELTDKDVEHWILQTLRNDKKYDRLSEYLERTSSLLNDAKQLQIPTDMKETCQRIQNGTDESDLKSIKNYLEEPDKEWKNGAYLCEYPIFRQVYQMEARRIERLGIAEYVIAFTLERIRKRKNNARKDQLMEEGRDNLESVMKKNLRSGDIVTHFNEVQSIVLLQACDYESAVKVAERIAVNFQKRYKRKKLDVYYEIAEITVTA